MFLSRFVQQILQSHKRRVMGITNQLSHIRHTIHNCHSRQSYTLFTSSFTMICWSCWLFNRLRRPILKHITSICKHIWNIILYCRLFAITHPVCVHWRPHGSAIASYIRHLRVVFSNKFIFLRTFFWQILIRNHLWKHTNMYLNRNSINSSLIIPATNVYYNRGNTRLSNCFVSLVHASTLHANNTRHRISVLPAHKTIRTRHAVANTQNNIRRVHIVNMRLVCNIYASFLFIIIT